MTRIGLWACVAVLFMGAACRPVVEDRSAFAAEAGQSTIALGACESDFKRGWAQCLIEAKSPMHFPTLRFVVTNPAEWAVSDCELGVFKTGATNAPGLVEVDLSGLGPQIEKTKLCILKIETLERYPDPRDPNQKRPLFMRGGLFIELVEPGFFPEPTNDVVSFCTKVSRTNKGRTRVETCRP